jgi:26S proteasome regulatory subunit T4
MEILKIHASKITKHGDIDYEAVVKLADSFNGADLRNICTEAGMFAIRDERDYVVQVTLGLVALVQSGALH